jgi:hypothetical protein
MTLKVKSEMIRRGTKRTIQGVMKRRGHAMRNMRQ